MTWTGNLLANGNREVLPCSVFHVSVGAQPRAGIWSLHMLEETPQDVFEFGHLDQFLIHRSSCDSEDLFV